MASTIKIKRSAVAGKKPTTTDIATGELALNTKDQKLFSSNGSSVFELANASALANTNSRITLLNSNLLGTNTAIRSLDAQKLSVANAVATYATKSNPTTSGLLAHTGRATISTNLTVSGNTTVSGTMTATGIVSGSELTSTLASGDEGGQINLAKPPNATTLGGVTIDAYQNKVRIFEQGGTARGVYIDLTAAAAGVGTNLLTGGSSTTQYLQVANAVATYATKAYAAANSYVKSVLANTNAYIGAQATRINLINTNLTGTNTALRTLISDRLQVANASAVYQTKSVERAALANTNSSIATQATRITLVNTNLLGTNTAIRALDAQKLSVANATTLLAAKATWAGLTGTNTAIRALVSDSLQVANAVATYQTKAVERAALANTNSSIATQTSRITLVNTNLTGTNTALRTLINDRLQVANASTLYATKSNPTTSGLLAHTGRATISTNLAVSGNTILSGTLVANGSSGTSGYYLRTSGTGLYWSPVSASGGGSTAQYLQVANAVATYQTKAVERAALANTNAYIATRATWSSVTGTNTALRTLISDRLQVANASSLYATKSNPTTSGLLAHTGRATISTNLTVSGNTTISAGLIANNSVGTAGYYLRSSGTGVYWSPAVTPNRVISYTDQNSITINADTTDTATQSYTGAAGTLTINAPTGTLVNGQKILYRLTTTNAQTFSWNAIFRGSTDLTLPTASSGTSKTDYLAFIYNSAASKWDLLAKNFGY